MHIVIVSDYGHVNGGASKIAITSARSLAERHHRVSFVCAVEPIDPALDHPNVRVHNLGFRDVWTQRNLLRAASRGIWNAEASRRLSDLLASFEHEDTIVHFHQWTKALSPSVIASAAQARLRHAFTLHDYFLFCPNGIYFDHARHVPCHRRPLSPSCLLAACDSRSRVHKTVRVVRQVGSNAALWRVPPPLNLIHVSASARRLAEHFFPRDSRHFVVHNPSTMSKVAPAPVRKNDVFVYLGRFTPEKGPVVFAGAAQAARVRAVFLGSGPERERILRANPQAEIRPWSTNCEVEALLGRARALIFPSLWYETSGLAVLEALSKGVPVICSHGTGAADWVEHGANGFLVPPGDAATLEERLARLRDDDELAERMGRYAYQHYWNESPMPERLHTNGLEACYRTILE